MVNLIPGANTKVKQLIFEDSVRSDYLSTCERFTNGYINGFIVDMQRLITKLGIIMSAVSNGPHINYCYTSINYLCKDVLDNPGLIKTFDELGVNQKGNQVKHTIAKDVHIEMQRCVTAYNNIVNRIMDKYGLKSLENMVVRKNRNPNVPSEVSRENYLISSPDTYSVKKPNNGFTKKAGTPTETAALTDGTIKLKATLERGDGRYTKGLFNKKSMVNFKLRIQIENQEGLKIKSITAYLKGRGNQLEKALPTTLTSVTDFDLPTETYGGNVEASVIAIYKIGVFKTKQLKVTVSKQF